MDFHRFTCECGETLSATGPRSLCMFVRAHDGLKCPLKASPYVERTDEQILAAPGYRKPEGACAYDPSPVVPFGSGVWSYEDVRMLKALLVSTVADLRGPQELAARYRNRPQDA